LYFRVEEIPNNLKSYTTDIDDRVSQPLVKQ